MSDAAGDPRRLMDAIYTRQRHVYDVTRKFYLLGRDQLVAGLRPPENGSVLEVACGTGRNLVAVARRYAGVRCFGLDVSAAMLATARRAVVDAGLEARISLAEADASSFDPEALFGRATFDRVVISYALSMIPPWRRTLRGAAALLAPGGSLHVVDFGDGERMPAPFNAALDLWLERFHVSRRLDLTEAARETAEELGLSATVQPLYRGYAVTAALTRRA